uniref:NPH3 domain-containing protein n=1 Tax=Chenopodium quinoa TaxID=63459 RepID=A0A803MBT8_CHEQI
MTLGRTKDSSSRCSKHAMPPNNRLLVCNTPFKLDKGLLAKKSATIASLLDNNPFEDLSVFFNEIPSEPEALELIARFCHGLHVEMTSDNIISLICLSNHLKMTETHCPNNLLNNAILFLKQKILPSWDQTIRSLRASQGPTFQQAVEIGLLDFCIEALTAHVLSDPNILAQPIMSEYTNNIINNRPISSNSNVTRRKLFSEGDHSTASSDSDTSTSTEDITSLPVKMYKSIVETMVQRQVPQENIAGSLFRYLKKHADDSEAIELIERLLPTCTISNKYPLYPYTLLFEMHELATSLKASSDCVASLEIRIGKELYRATPEDLLALDLDIESLKRVLKGFYENFTDPDSSSLVAVADLMEEYLLEVAKKRNMDAKSFTEVAEMASSTSNVGTYRYSDGIYRAVDAYLDKNTELSELEREEVCRVLDFQKMSSQASSTKG